MRERLKPSRWARDYNHLIQLGTRDLLSISSCSFHHPTMYPDLIPVLALLLAAIANLRYYVNL